MKQKIRIYKIMLQIFFEQKILLLIIEFYMGEFYHKGIHFVDIHIC